LLATPTLIYCAGGNRRLAEIAQQAGYELGAQLPGTVYFQIYFGDQNWRSPNRSGYMRALSEHRPVMATVIDWTRDVDFLCVMDWAEEAAQFVQYVLVVPKIAGSISQLPRRVGGRDIVLAYSVPTRYGGTDVPVWEFSGWPVHLLGGSPRAQINAYFHLRAVNADVISVDGNYAQKVATRYNQFFSYPPLDGAVNRWWPTLMEADGRKWGDGTIRADAPYEAFRRSCKNILRYWHDML